MTLQELRCYCLAKPGATEDFPLDFTTLVMKAGGKMFLLTDVEDVPIRISLKCESMYAQTPREKYLAIIPGYHLNKQHWNAVIPDGSVPGKLLHQMIDMSYKLVFASLTKAKREQILKAENT